MRIEMKRRMLCDTPVFHIDANLINARGMLDTMNQIDKWYNDEVILVNMSGVSFREAKAGGNPIRTRKALSHIFTDGEEIGPSDFLYRTIEAALFPAGAKTTGQDNDVKIVCEAARYAAILVTADGGSRRQPGGILGNRSKLKDIVRVLSDFEAVALIRRNIEKRDSFNRRVVSECGGELPEWTGKD